jgi:hypothetical protein
MNFTFRSGRLLCAAALLAVPSVGLAQDNATNAAINATEVTNTTTADPALNDSMAADAATSDSFNTAAPMDDPTLANDMALANTVEPERDDNDFPWGLLGLLGLAGLLGRKKNDGDIHVDARRDS